MYKSLSRPIVAVCFACLGVTSLSCADRGGETVRPGAVNGEKRMLTKNELIAIARETLEDKCGLDTKGLRITYDTDNRIWAEYYAEDYPSLANRDYQAVRFERRGSLAPGGGPYWVCIDTHTGEVLELNLGM